MTYKNFGIWNQKQLKLQNELQEYFEALITPSLKAELSQPEYFEGGGPEFKKAFVDENSMNMKFFLQGERSDYFKFDLTGYF